MDDLERQLDWERAGRGRVAVSAMAAGALVLAGAVFGTLVVLGAPPPVGLLEGLDPILAGRPAGVDPHAVFIDHHAAALIAAAVLIALGTLGLIPVLRYLYEATRFRLEGACPPVSAGANAPVRGAPRLPRAALILAILGAGLGAVALLAAQVVDVIKAHEVVGSTGAASAAVTQAGRVLSWLTLATQLALAFAFVMIPLNAMRAGLLTRFMGGLGIVSGALIVLPRLQLLQAFWLVALGLMLSGRTKSPLPPAWESAKAEPWPTQQQLREARERAREPALATPAPVPQAPPPARPGPNAAKKRKKRR